MVKREVKERGREIIQETEAEKLQNLGKKIDN